MRHQSAVSDTAVLRQGSSVWCCVLTVLGIACYWTHRNPDGIGLSPYAAQGAYDNLLYYLAFLISIVVADIIALFHIRRIEDKQNQTKACVVVAGISALVTVFLLVMNFSATALPAWATCLRSIVQGVWVVTMMLSWPWLLVRIKGRLFIILPTLAFMLSFVFSYLRLDLLSQTFSQFCDVLLAVFPLLSGLCWCIVFINLRASQGVPVPARAFTTRISAISRSTAWRIGIVLITSFTMNIIRSFLIGGKSISATDNILMYALSIVMAAVFLVIEIKSKRTDSSVYWVWATIVLSYSMACVLWSGLFPIDVFFVTESVVAAATYGVTLFFWLVLLQESKQKKISVSLLYAISCIPMKVVIGVLMSLIIPGIVMMVGPIPRSISIALYLFLFLGIVVVLLSQRIRRLFDMEHCDTASPDASVDSLEDIAGELTAEYGLSMREAQVAALIAHGYSMKRIADMLVISPSTVQTHAKHIYRKMNITSRQELMDLVMEHKTVDGLPLSDER